MRGLSLFKLYLNSYPWAGSCCLLAVLLLAVNSRAIEIKVATGVNGDPPYVYGDTEISTSYPGVTIDILRLIETKYDIKFIITKLPWKRVVAKVKDNQLDGGFHFSFKQKRKSFVAYPIKVGQTEPAPKYSISNRSYTLYRLQGQSIHWSGQKIIWPEARNLTVAAIRGGSIIEDLKAAGHEVLEVSNDLQLINLLLSQRVHSFVALENMIDPKIQNLPSTQRVLIEKSLPAIVNKPYYIAFSKKFYQEHKGLAWKIWQTIEEIKTNGELQKIYSRYSNKP